MQSSTGKVKKIVTNTAATQTNVRVSKILRELYDNAFWTPHVSSLYGQ